MTDRKILVLGCGAISAELVDVLGRMVGATYTLECLPGILHNRPERIAPEIRRRLDRLDGRFDQVIIGYADCGTGGGLAGLVAEYEHVSMLDGAHCYEFFSGTEAFAALNDPTTFYLTDYLARHFDVFVWKGLGLDRWPHLRDDYFGNYRRLVYLSQRPDDDLMDRARAAADRLGLSFEHHHTGLEPLEAELGRSEAKVPT